MDKGCIVSAVFMDFKKVFETVNNEILCSWLFNFNFSTEYVV